MRVITLIIAMSFHLNSFADDLDSIGMGYSLHPMNVANPVNPLYGDSDPVALHQKIDPFDLCANGIDPLEALSRLENINKKIKLAACYHQLTNQLINVKEQEKIILHSLVPIASATLYSYGRYIGGQTNPSILEIKNTQNWPTRNWTEEFFENKARSNKAVGAILKRAGIIGLLLSLGYSAYEYGINQRSFLDSLIIGFVGIDLSNNDATFLDNNEDQIYEFLAMSTENAKSFMSYNIEYINLVVTLADHLKKSRDLENK